MGVIMKAESIKEKLENYNEIKLEIARLRLKITRLKNEEVNPSGGILEPTGIKAEGYRENPIENKAIDNAEKRLRYENSIKEYEAEIAYIDSLINTLKHIEQEVIRAYYIDKKSIANISKTKDRSEKHIYKIIDRAINKMEMILK